jgi:hypothetical protein
MEVLGEQFELGAGTLPVFLQRFAYEQELGKGKLINLEIGKQQTPPEDGWGKFYKQPLSHVEKLLSTRAERRGKKRLRWNLIREPVRKWRNAALSGDAPVIPVGELKVPDAMQPGDRNSEPELIHRLQNLKAGTYFTEMPYHMTAYVRISAMQSFFFDPNLGIFEITGTNQGQGLCKRLLKSWERLLSLCRGDCYYERACNREFTAYLTIIRVDPRPCLMPIAREAGPWQESTSDFLMVPPPFPALSLAPVTPPPTVVSPITASPNNSHQKKTQKDPSSSLQPQQPSNTDRSSSSTGFGDSLASLGQYQVEPGFEL